MQIVAILQARFSSTRLPGKVLLPLADSTVLGQVTRRVRRAARLNDVWVATSLAPSDDQVEAEARRIGAPCFRGDLNDVLGRYHAAARTARAEVIVRITCDCPLFDGKLLDGMLKSFLDESQRDARIDYCSNVLQRTYPRGLDAEIFTFDALDRAMREAVRPYDREHVTPYFYTNPDRFVLRSYTGTPDLSHLRWTLDTPADWDLIQQIYAACGTPDFSTGDVLALLEQQPALRLVNAHIEQKRDV